MASQYRTRDYLPYGLVHLTVRGYNRKRIFLDDQDQHEFTSIYRRLINQCAHEERPKHLGHAQLSNHQHLFVQHGNSGTTAPRIMHSLKISYAKSFNDRYNQSGPVFESPYRGRTVRGGDDIINVLTYLHLNPTPA